MDYTLYTVGGFGIFVNILNQIAALLKSDGGSVFWPFVKMASATGIVYCVIYAIWQLQLRAFLSWFVTNYLILNILLIPTASVHVVDTMTGQHDTVDNVPFGFALIACTTSQLGHGLARAVDQVFQPSPTYALGNPDGMANTSFNDLSYTKTGYIFGAMAISQMKGMQIVDADFEDNMHEFCNQCVMYDALIGTKYTMHDLKHSDNIWALVSERPSKMRGMGWRNVKRENGRRVGVAKTEIITCAEAVAKINEVYKQATESALENVTGKLLSNLNIAYMKNGNEALNLDIMSRLPGALNHLTKTSESTTDRIWQQLMITTLIKGNELKSVEMGHSPNFDVRRAYLQQRATYDTMGRSMVMWMPAIKNTIEALVFCLFIFIMPMCLLPQGYKFIVRWFKFNIWIQLCEPIYAIFNFLATQSLANGIANHTIVEGGFTIANFVGIESLAANTAMFAGYATTGAFVIAWALVEGGGVAMAQILTGMMGVTQNPAAQAAAEKESGNIAIGVITEGVVQARNSMMNKYNDAGEYASGHFTSHDGTSTRTIGADGRQVLTSHMSSIPVSVNSAYYQEQSLRTSQTNAENLHRSENTSASNSLNLAGRELLEFSKQANEHINSGVQFNNSETKTLMTEASDVYSKVHQIADSLNVSDESVIQTTLQLHAGVDIGKTYIGGMLGLSGGTSLQHNRTNNNVTSKAINDLNQLAHSKDFKELTSVAQAQSKSQSLDMGSQKMEQNIKSFGNHWEDSKQHTKNASVAWEQSQSYGRQADDIRSNSHRIDVNENQRFVQWAAKKVGGVDKLDAMIKEDQMTELRILGEQYLGEHYGKKLAPTPAPDLKVQYQKGSESLEQAKPSIYDMYEVSPAGYVSRTPERIMKDEGIIPSTYMQDLKDKYENPLPKSKDNRQPSGKENELVNVEENIEKTKLDIMSSYNTKQTKNGG